eukprot:c13117_g2_i1.p1 GENE.c13117_g2_i1~~c13117_g2_i1.p1  ORF type:complete len:363 (-),score=96.16 c13117_g2_i1:876-1943(-)
MRMQHKCAVAAVFGIIFFSLSMPTTYHKHQTASTSTAIAAATAVLAGVILGPQQPPPQPQQISSNFSIDERAAFALAIRTQCVRDFAILAQQAKRLNVLSDELRSIVDMVLVLLTQEGTDVLELPHHENVRSTIQALWHSDAIQRTFAYCRVRCVMDSTQHFLDHIENICAPDFLPSDTDILMNYMHTSERVETLFKKDNLQFRLIDVGTNRNDRRKYNSVDAVIFVVAMSDFDMSLPENAQINKLVYSLQCFQQTCSISQFREVSMLVVLNKIDVFREKLKSTNLNVCFPDYTGGRDFTKATQFVSNKFREVCRSTQACITHCTCALESRDIKLVLQAVNDFTLCQNVILAGIM